LTTISSIILIRRGVEERVTAVPITERSDLAKGATSSILTGAASVLPTVSSISILAWIFGVVANGTQHDRGDAPQSLSISHQVGFARPKPLNACWRVAVIGSIEDHGLGEEGKTLQMGVGFEIDRGKVVSQPFIRMTF
jgi:hypothetical protein